MMNERTELVIKWKFYNELSIQMKKEAEKLEKIINKKDKENSWKRSD